MSGRCGIRDVVFRHHPHDSHVVSELEHESTCPSEITAADFVGQQAGVPELVGCNIKSLLGGINFGFQVSSRPDTATRQFAATASELAYTGWQVLVGHVNLYVVLHTYSSSSEHLLSCRCNAAALFVVCSVEKHN